MVKAGACGFCGTAVEGVAHAHLEEHVDHRVRKAEDALRRELREELREELDDREPSAVTVAAVEAGRYTAAKVWGCGAGCLSTIGSLIMFLVILGASMGPVLYQTWLEHKAKQPVIEKPKPMPLPKPAPNRKKPRPKRRR
jgi:hypothetical protein